jgi:hypothetical protein
MCPSPKNSGSSKREIKYLLYQNRISHRKDQKDAPNPALPKPVLAEPSNVKPERVTIEVSTPAPILSNKINRLNIVLTCVNYSDFLVLSLAENVKIIDPKFITVVTDSSDILTKKLCETFGVNCVVTDRFYDDGAVFNKGKAINEGINSLVNPEWILLTDADIIFPADFLTILNEKTVNVEKLYAASRYMCRSYDTYLKYKENTIALSEIGGVHRCPPVGYFQLFSYGNTGLTDKNKIYPENSIDASWSDMLFADKFPQKECLPNMKLIHLGDDSKNWKGRKTQRFLDDDEMSELIAGHVSHPFKPSIRKKIQKSDKLAVITSFFNPANYENNKSNYNRFKTFIADAGVDLFTAELVFDNQEFFTEENEYNLHIRGGVDNIMWQKERLLNLLLDKIPSEYNNIAWIDCDVIFENENWVNEINNKLRTYKLLQLFENVKFTGPRNEINNSRKGIIKHLYDDKQKDSVDFDLKKGGTPGLAWAIRRECIKKVKFIDTQILGGADGLMMLASVGCFEKQFIYDQMNIKWKSDTLVWSVQFFKEIENSVFFIPGEIIHLYHGDIVKRNYSQRGKYLSSNNYEPKTDITLDNNGVWKWNSDKPIMHKQVNGYFFERDEDENINSVNVYFDGIFCINLDRCQNKWETVNKRFVKNNIQVERVRAYDGSWPIVKNEWEKVKVNLNTKYGDQILKASNYGLIENEFAYGTLCSHIQVIQLAKQRKLKKILVFEDDVIFHTDFIRLMRGLKEFVNWKLLYLGASQHNWDNIKIDAGYYHPYKTLGGFAYALDSSVFDEVLGLLTTYEKSFDNCLANFNDLDVQTKYKNECYTLYPNIVIADVRESELRGQRDMTEHAKKMKWDLYLYDFS